MRLRSACATGAIIAIVVTTACGDTTNDNNETQPKAPSPTVDETAFCNSLFDLLAASDEDLDINPEESSRKEILEASIRWYGSEKAERLMATAEENAPAALADEVETLTSGLREFADTGDLKATQKTIGQAQRKIDAYQEKECPEPP